MPLPIGTIRKAATTEGQLTAAGLWPLIRQLPELVGQQPQTIEHRFTTAVMARRAMRLLYQWLWFHPELKMFISLRVLDNTLFVIVKSGIERRGRRGRKVG